MERRIKSIKFSKDHRIIIMSWEEQDAAGSWDEWNCKWRKEPLPEFPKAFEALAEQVRQIMEWPKEELDLISVRSVKLSYAGDEDVMGATISVVKSLRNRINGYSATTPYLSSQFIVSEDGDERQLLPDSTVRQLNILCEHAFDFIDGKRAQLSLFDEEESEEGMSESDDAGGNGKMEDPETADVGAEEEVF